MKSDKRQTYLMLGIALLIIGGVIIAVSLSQPKTAVTQTVSVSSVSNVPTDSTSAPTITVTNKSGKVSVSYPLNINKATLEELMTIDGLGEKKASAIIEYRNYLGGYTSVDQIMEIEGFGEETYKDVAGYLTV